MLTLIVGVSAAEMVLAANIWAPSSAAQGFVTAADGGSTSTPFRRFTSSSWPGLRCSVRPLPACISRTRPDHVFTPAVARRFGALWLGSLTAMMLVLVSNNLGIMWVGMEATTLLTAFLISLYPIGCRSRRCGNT